VNLINGLANRQSKKIAAAKTEGATKQLAIRKPITFKRYKVLAENKTRHKNLIFGKPGRVCKRFCYRTLKKVAT
jgi:hypothetical protein